MHDLSDGQTDYREGRHGWEAVGRYIYAFYDTAKFTKFAVPDATSFKGCQAHHRFIGLCEDRRKHTLIHTDDSW